MNIPMDYKYIKATIAFFMLAGTTSSAVFGNNPGTLNELEVRGSKNFENLDLSRSTILSQDTLESHQINSLQDLNGLSSNLHLSGNGIKSFGDVLTMRGIGNTQFFGSPGVQLYVDGVPQGNVFSYGSDLYDLEAVEVLKGPQGGRFGKLAPGGAINLITKKPGETQTSKVSASYATFNTQKYNISSSGPMDEEFSYSLGVQRSSSDGFLNNTSGQDNDSETWNGRLSFHWDGGAGTKATLGTSFTSHELGAQPLVLRNGGDFYDRSTNFDEYTNIDQNKQFLKLEHELDSGELLLISSRNDWEMEPSRLDIDLTNQASLYTTPGPDFVHPLHYMFSTIEQNQEIWSQEIRYINSNDSLTWSIGAFYEDSDMAGDATRFVGVPQDSSNLLSPYFGMPIPTLYELKSKNTAGFIDGEKKISDSDTLSVNLRYDHFDKSFVRSNFGVQTHDKSKNFSNTSGSFSWSRKFSNSIDLGLIWGYSEKPGGFSAFTSTPGQDAFSEEIIISYETYLKINSSDSWQLCLNVFYNEVEDYQFELNGEGMDYYLENADEVSIYGIEIDSLWFLGGGWTFAAAYGLTESEFQKVSILPSLVGKPVTFVPDQSLSLVLAHELDNGLSYQIGSRTIGKTYFWDNTGINQNDMIDSYTLLDAQIGYNFKDWYFNIFGTNLTNEEYYTSLVSHLKSPEITAAPGVAGSPRVIGLSISKEF
jgi:iron complex outermembrane receptor protein